MARTYARLSCDGVRDPDWLTLGPGPQWLYVVLLRQVKLSLCGHLDYHPSRWCAAAGVTTEQVERWLDDLAAKRYVVVDRDTDEVLIRSFAKHDLTPGMLSAKVIAGLWSQWTTLLSATLRAVFVTECPEAVWAKLEPTAPLEAVEIRRSPPLESETPPPIETGERVPFECPSSFIPHPSTFTTTKSQDHSQPDPEQELRRAAVAVGRQLAQDAADPAAYAASITRRILTGDDPTDRERITAALGLGESVETIAAGWEPVRPDWLSYAGGGAASGQADGPDTAGFYAGREALRREQMQDQAPADPAVARSAAQAAREALRAPVAAS